MVPKFFGQYLLERQIITPAELVRAIKYQEDSKQKLGELAVTRGYMSKKQVEEIHQKQKRTDAMFGELAMETGYLNKGQLDELITIQRNSYIYLGEALITLKILKKGKLDELLQQFKQEQENDQVELDIPFEIEEKEYIPLFVDMTVKLLRRVGNIVAKPGGVIYKEGKTNVNFISILIEIAGAVNLRYMLSLTEEAVKKIATEYLGSSVKDKELMIENAAEFVNMVCGNILTVLERDGKRGSITVPKVIKGGKEATTLNFEKNEKAIVVPLVTTEGYCEIQILISNVGVVEMAGAGKKRILIVDDSKSVAYKLTKIIESMPGFDVMGHALTGEEAVEMYHKEKADLVTMDLVLPGMSGIEAIRAIVGMDPDARIVVISSVGGGQERLFEAIQAGARNVITKPFNDETVKNVFTQSVM